jgi:hypothetical protein
MTKGGFLSDPPACIIIPAADFTQPTKPNKLVMVMPSFLGGQQLHIEQDGSVEYQLPSAIPKESYVVSCRIVNVHQHQAPLLLTVKSQEDDDMIVDLYSIGVDYTIGAWKYTKPIEIQLTPGGILKF